MYLQKHIMVLVAAFPLVWILLQYSCRKLGVRREEGREGGGSTQCTLKTSLVKLRESVLNVGKCVFCFQKPKISISFLEGL